MANYSKKSVEELEVIYENSNSYGVEQELLNRGYEQDDNGYFEFEEEYGKEEEDFGLGALFLLIVGALLVMASLIGTHYILGYSTNYTSHILICFALTSLFMVLSSGKSKFFNFLFYLGCFALATRLFVPIIEMLENDTYVNFITRDATTLSVLIKYGFYYGVYITLVPYISMKIITALTRSIRKPHVGGNGVPVPVGK
ncbi:hypothetical protein [Sutcliffiella horikoshii]|uniref:hypothetical protein n=1 Tax=Sutcliffiella horikoshii TaxID=79883 RepID=UPI003CFA3FD4